jgi:hypothetical protein
MFARLKAWYYTSIQTHLASALMALTLLDLTGYQAEIERFIHPAGYALLRLVGLGAIWYRARQVKREPP